MGRNEHGFRPCCQGNGLTWLSETDKVNRDSQLESDNIALLRGNTVPPVSDPQCAEGDCASHLSGVKANFPPSATMTVMVSAQTQAARPKKAETMAAKRIFQTKRESWIVGGGSKDWRVFRSR